MGNTLHLNKQVRQVNSYPIQAKKGQPVVVLGLALTTLREFPEGVCEKYYV